MSLFGSVGDTIKNVFSQVDAKTAAGLISAILAKTDLGDLQGIVSKLQSAGFGEQVKSWLGNGENLPITAEQLRSALGNEQVQQVARELGLPIDDALNFLAQHVPNAVDNARSEWQFIDIAMITFGHRTPSTRAPGRFKAPALAGDGEPDLP